MAASKKHPAELLTANKVLKQFPLAKPRDIQVVAIEKTVEAYRNGAKYVVLEAPTGTGKSALGLAFARAMGDRSYMLTLTEQLQEQYVRDFGAKFNLAALKGKAKFTCNRARASCAVGTVLYKGGNQCDPCAYRVAKQAALSAKHCVANYHSYLHNIGPLELDENGEPLDEERIDLLRPLTVLDECHTIESFLLDQIGVTVRKADWPLVELADFPEERSDPSPYLDYVEKELIPKLKAFDKNLVDPAEKDELRLALSKLSAVVRFRGEDWVPERGENDGKLEPGWFSLKPLRVARYGPWVTSGGERQLFMSGTVLSAMQFVTSIGLDPNEGEHIELPSPFPAENRPIIARGLDMTFRARDTSWPEMARIVDGLLTHHKNDKGLLLTPSNAMLKYIRERLGRVNQARLITAYGDDRMEKYRMHLTAKMPSVLAASGFWEGADLAGDASRFQIIPALPRPFWAGQVKARASMEPTWYRWQTMTKLLQGYGRSIRSETDEAVTYILDVEFTNEMKARDCMFPAWVRDAVRIVEGSTAEDE